MRSVFAWDERVIHDQNKKFWIQANKPSCEPHWFYNNQKTSLYVNEKWNQMGWSFSGHSMLSARPGFRRNSSGYSLANCRLYSSILKGALGPLLSAPAGASKRETPTSDLIESTGHYNFFIWILFCNTYHPTSISKVSNFHSDGVVILIRFYRTFF